jgi:hypothetical protein
VVQDVHGSGEGDRFGDESGLGGPLSKRTVSSGSRLVENEDLNLCE